MRITVGASSHRYCVIAKLKLSFSRAVYFFFRHVLWREDACCCWQWQWCDEGWFCWRREPSVGVPQSCWLPWENRRFGRGLNLLLTCSFLFSRLFTLATLFFPLKVARIRPWYAGKEAFDLGDKLRPTRPIDHGQCYVCLLLYIDCSLTISLT